MIDIDKKAEVKKIYECEMQDDPVFRRVMKRLAKL